MVEVVNTVSSPIVDAIRPGTPPVNYQPSEQEKSVVASLASRQRTFSGREKILGQLQGTGTLADRMKALREKKFLTGQQRVVDVYNADVAKQNELAQQKALQQQEQAKAFNAEIEKARQAKRGYWVRETGEYPNRRRTIVSSPQPGDYFVDVQKVAPQEATYWENIAQRQYELEHPYSEATARAANIAAGTGTSGDIAYFAKPVFQKEKEIEVSTIPFFTKKKEVTATSVSSVPYAPVAPGYAVQPSGKVEKIPDWVRKQIGMSTSTEEQLYAAVRGYAPQVIELPSQPLPQMISGKSIEQGFSPIKISMPEQKFEPTKIGISLPTGEKIVEKDLGTQILEFKGIGGTLYEYGKGFSKGVIELIPETVEEMRAKTKERLKPEFRENALAIALSSIPLTISTFGIEAPLQTIAYLGEEGITGVSSRAFSLIDSPEKVGKLGLSVLAFKGAEGLSSRMLFGRDLTEFGAVKSIAQESTKGKVTLMSLMEAKTGGLIGKKFEITSNVLLKPVEIEKLFKDSGFLKLKKAPIRVALAEEAGTNYLRLDVGKQVLLLPEKVADKVLVKQETGLVLSQAELVKFREKVLGYTESTISKMKASKGQPFSVSSEGVVRVRQLGFKERIGAKVFPNRNDFVKQIELAQKRGIRLGTTKEVRGLTIGTVESRKISFPSKKIKETYPTKFTGQLKLDLRRLVAPTKKFVEKTGLPIKLSGIGKELGIKFGKIKNGLKLIKPSKVTMTGTKGKLRQIEFSSKETLISTPRTFMTQDILVEFGKRKQFKASRVKVEGYPMEMKTLTKTFREKPVESEWVNAIKGKKLRLESPKIEVSTPKAQLEASRKLYLPADEFKPPAVSDAALENIFKRMEAKPLTLRGTELTNFGISFTQQKGIGLAQKTITSTKGIPKVEQGVRSFVSNLSASGSGTLLQFKPKVSEKTKPRVEERLQLKLETPIIVKPKISDLSKTRFSFFARAQTMQSQAIKQATSQAQKQEQSFRQAQKQFNAQIVTQPVIQAQAQLQAQRVIQAQAQAQSQAQKQAQKQVQKQLSKTQKIITPRIIEIEISTTSKKKRDLKENPFELSKQKVVKGFIAFARVRGKLRKVSDVLPYGKAFEVGKGFVEKTTARTFVLKEAGYTSQRDSLKPDYSGLRKARKVKGGFVEINKRAINTFGEVYGLRKAKKEKRRLF